MADVNGQPHLQHVLFEYTNMIFCEKLRYIKYDMFKNLYKKSPSFLLTLRMSSDYKNYEPEKNRNVLAEILGNEWDF